MSAAAAVKHLDSDMAASTRPMTATAANSGAGERPNSLESFDVPSPVLRLPEGAVLFSQGSAAKDIYFVSSGIVKLVHSHQGSEALTVGLRFCGALLGGAAAVLGSDHHVTAETVTPCELQHFNRRDFRQLLMRDLRFSRRVNAILSAELMGGFDQITGLLALSSRDRLEYLLRRLSRHDDSNQRHASKRLALPVRLRDLAHLLGVTPEHLSRLLAQLEKEGMFRRDKGWFVFPAMA